MYSCFLQHLVLLGTSVLLFHANAEDNTNNNKVSTNFQLFTLSIYFLCQQLKELFENIEGDLAITRDYCLKDNLITINDLKIYEDPERVPESLTCFFKCLYTQTEIIGADGEMDVDALAILPGFDKSRFGEVKRCMERLGKIKTCRDMKKAAKCINLAVAI
ncbi:hypothetical protein Zmor_018529 [Zophobas morio]|uniref:Uncharacterized protein n=1 Tax=Zophobas morio TaxID=2755281 RepID=A0AA38IAS6_9CUCU|nr:hypothetical protein Zmor_018529 [Zophobas morio]